MHTNLFIGGPWDGKRYVVSHDRLWHHVLVMPDTPIYSHPDDCVFQTVDYVRMPFRGNSERFDLWVLQGMTADDVVRKLIENYPQPKEGS